MSALVQSSFPGFSTISRDSGPLPIRRRIPIVPMPFPLSRIVLARQTCVGALFLDMIRASSRSRNAHLIFWAPFTLVGDGGSTGLARRPLRVTSGHSEHLSETSAPGGKAELGGLLSGAGCVIAPESDILLGTSMRLMWQLLAFR